MFCHIRFKACKKCGGDLSLEQDEYGRYFECIQCGAVLGDRDLAYPSTHLMAEPQFTSVNAPLAVR